MKSVGIVRKVDELGRIVLPIELRRSLEIDVKEALEIFVDGKQIVLQKYQPDAVKQAAIKGAEEVALKLDSKDAEAIQSLIKLIK